MNLAPIPEPVQKSVEPRQPKKPLNLFEPAIVKRLQGFADAGVTDISVRVVPIGESREELIRSSKRTRELLGALATTL